MPTPSHTPDTSSSSRRLARIMARLRSRDATDGRAEVRDRLDAFRKHISTIDGEAAKRITELREHDLAHFAVDDLLPSRIMAARKFLAPITAADARHLDQYLDSVESSTRGEVAATDTADDVADAVVRAVEDLHNYLLGHDIVDRRYRRHSLGSSLFRRERHTEMMLSLDSWRAADRAAPAEPTAATDSHEYALAA